MGIYNHNLLILSIIFFLYSCGGKKNKIEPSNKVESSSAYISISDYSVGYGNSNKELIEEGLENAVKVLNSYFLNQDKIAGTIEYIFKCEPNGVVRWISAGESNLDVINESEVKNKLTRHLMESQITFPKLGETTMIMVNLKFL